MIPMEQLEMDAHRGQLARDLAALVEKYRRIFEWDVPEVDEALSDRLIFAALRQSLDHIESQLDADGSITHRLPFQLRSV